MDELNQFLNSVEASARRILKQQTKKQQELIARERAALVRAAKGQGASYATASPTKSISRDELKASYTPGGALVVAAPRSPLSPSRRSEHEADDPTVLPRLPPPSSSASPADTVAKSPSGVLSPPVLPAIDQRRSSTNNHNNNSKDAALEAARKNQRERRAAGKILNSPLYKSLARSAKAEQQGFSRGGSDVGSPQAIKKAIQDVDSVNMLLKRLGMRDNSSPTRRPDHAVERRMCNACWAQPHKLTGCEHHAQILPRNGSAANVAGLSDEALMLRQMELQGPTSWLSDDLFVKYRSEGDRERLWFAYCRLKELEAERGDDATDVAVIPVVSRHPIVHKFFTQTELENLKTQAETRKRNLTKTPYDPPEFIPELRALFIPKANADLQEKKLQWAEFMASRQAVVEGPIASKATKGLTQAAKDALFERDPNEAQADLEKLVAKAIVYARNNNLSGLEAALDDGVDVNARDNHGNTLFILVCQQGNKKMAKFLLRRGANANLQNMNGNTALHYLVEYKHTELAEYLKSKGASDTIQNAAGLTCYEGLSVDQVEAL
ncbi:hypothetical protein P43SY_009365 [Pythium insidiosum]|uniref:TKL protein kinase n=1 Tax=Pythium insidiosum TaxID=114742 RepID=A0AAD5LTJ0_PYTIN|nr:hypothetical protein P43SY_009365 [Pythium insidiosum]